MGEKYGRDETLWADYIRFGHLYLVQKAKLGLPTDYTALNGYLRERTDSSGFDFSQQSDRTAMGELLGDIVREDLPTSGYMITSIVMYLDENRPGEGFYRLAESLGRLPLGASAETKEQFWVDEMKGIYAKYGRSTRRTRAEE